MILHDIEIHEHKHGVPSSCYIRLEGEIEDLNELALEIHKLINQIGEKENV